MREVALDHQKDYACEDADITLRLYHMLKPDLIKQSLAELAEKIEMPLIDVLTDMELAGFRIDIEALHNFEVELNTEIKTTEEEIIHFQEKSLISHLLSSWVLFFSRNLKLVKIRG